MFNLYDTKAICFKQKEFKVDPEHKVLFFKQYILQCKPLHKTQSSWSLKSAFANKV